MPGPTAPEPLDARTPWSMTAAWAAYLACSWTWCIGMFLPVLLVRDFGTPAFWVFAVPNVLGAAALGWVLSRRSSAELVRVHAPAMRLFSLVTVAFHLVFLAWLLGGAWSTPWLPISVLAAVLVLTAIFALMPARVQAGAAAVIVLATAMIVAGLAWVGPGWLEPNAQDLVRFAELRLPDRHLAPLAAVCLFGFLLCPYLDLTFLRVRAQTSPHAGRVAFTLGFGVLFLGFVLLTLAYRGAFLWEDRSLTPLLLAHIAVQAAYTMGVHLRAVADSGPSGRPHPGGLILAGVVIAGLLVAWPLGSLLGPIDRVDHLYRGMGLGEQVYRGFMAFYGLVFPAYVWLCVVPRRGQPLAAPARRGLIVFGVAVALATPAYWVAFMQGQTWWLLAGVGVVLVARVLVVSSEPARVTSRPGDSRQSPPFFGVRK